MSSPPETTRMGRFEGYGPPIAGAPMAPGSAGQIASGFAGVASTGKPAEGAQAAIDDIREYCDDVADIGGHAVYIEVIDGILKRHGLK